MNSHTFARYVFWTAAIWGVLVIAPLYVLYDRIGVSDPPPITHPGFYYGFVITALAWQVLFAVIARDPVRYTGIMPVAMLEKFGYAVTVFVLFAQHRMHASDLVFGLVDATLGLMFLVAFVKCRRAAAVPART
jgi:hypothetical protein